MRKYTIVLLSLILLCTVSLCAAEDLSFPADLRTIEDEAFMNTAVEGLVQLPDTVESMGNNVFRNTGLYALEVPGGVTALGEQGLEGQGVAYALLKGSAVPGAGLRGVRYLFFAGNTVPSDVPEGSIPISLGDLISDGLFYYRIEDGYAEMLCAVNNLLVPSEIEIGDDVYGLPVTRIAGDAFIGCPQIASISLPEYVETAEDSFISCPDATVTYRSSANTLNIWVADRAVELTDTLLAAFWDAHPEYSAWNYRIFGVSESEAVNTLLDHQDMLPDVYSFAQDQLAVLASAGFLDAPGSGYAADIRSGNDAGPVAAATLNGSICAYPLTSDNGYFLYYDKSVITDPSSLESILSDCEAAGRTFCAELTSGWYNVMFFFGTGCRLDYTLDSSGSFTGFSGSLANENGLRALKAMISVAQSTAFVNSSTATEETDMVALVSGTWDARTVLSRFGQNAVATKLPTCSGFQLGSFSGNKLLGVVAQDSAERLALAHAVAAFLSGEEAQTQRQNQLGWLASRPAARANASSTWYADALAAQSAYSTPQGQLPGAYWSYAQALGNRVISGELDSMTDAQLMDVLQQYQNDLTALVQ